MPLVSRKRIKKSLQLHRGTLPLIVHLRMYSVKARLRVMEPSLYNHLYYFHKVLLKKTDGLGFLVHLLSVPECARCGDWSNWPSERVAE